MQVDHFVAHHTRSEVIAALAAHLTTRLVELVEDGTKTAVVLSGGEDLHALLDYLEQGRERDSVDWPSVELYVSDDLWEFSPERFCQRVGQFAREVGAHFHPLPDSGSFSQPEEGANAFAGDLGLGKTRMPSFDLAILGIGANASVAGLFPEHPVLHDNRWMAAVRGVGEPRITMTVPLLSNCDEIWLVATGSTHQEAIRLTLSERAGLRQAPAAAIRGKYRTSLYTDVDAAGELAEAARLASP